MHSWQCVNMFMAGHSNACEHWFSGSCTDLTAWPLRIHACDCKGSRMPREAPVQRIRAVALIVASLASLIVAVIPAHLAQQCLLLR